MVCIQLYRYILAEMTTLSLWNLPAQNCSEDSLILVLYPSCQTSLTLNQRVTRGTYYGHLRLASCLSYEFTSPEVPEGAKARSSSQQKYYSKEVS